MKLVRRLAVILGLLLLGEGSTAAPAATGNSQGVPVFMYHRIDRAVPSDEIGRELTIDPRELEDELRRLERGHVRTMTAAALVDALAQGHVPQRTVVLTFDDGYADHYDVVLPLLQKYHAVATFYVLASTIGLPHHLSWREIRELQRNGMEIGAHGVEHLDLSTLTPAQQDAQAGGCVRAIRRWTGRLPSTYAYPSGQYDAATLTVMREVKMRAAFTTQPGLVSSLARPYELPRIRLNRRDATQVFAEYVPRGAIGAR